MNKSEIEFIRSFSDHYFDDDHNNIFVRDQNSVLRFHLDLKKNENIKDILDKNSKEIDTKSLQLEFQNSLIVTNLS